MNSSKRGDNVDISFHYFAVKTLSCLAGFSDSDAQIIAEYSQFVDDYNWHDRQICLNIPTYARESNLDLVNGLTFVIFNPATTGFSALDYSQFTLFDSQKYILHPFHFIPRDSAHVSKGDRRAYPATISDGSYISNLLAEARNEFQKEENQSGDNRKYCLMHIGMLLHTFADTYAHQLFTGYFGWENNVILDQVINNITKKDETLEYQKDIVMWSTRTIGKISPNMPMVSHMMIKNVPDLAHVSFTMKYQISQGLYSTHTRNNTEVFVNKTSREILNYLRSCLKSKEITNTEWDLIAKKMSDSFLIDISKLVTEAEKVSTLTAHWGVIWSLSYPNYQYAYSSNEIKKRFKPNIIFRSHDFYKYNVFADKRLVALFGPRPRK
jgi:hypothetical protein